MGYTPTIIVAVEDIKKLVETFEPVWQWKDEISMDATEREQKRLVEELKYCLDRPQSEAYKFRGVTVMVLISELTGRCREIRSILDKAGIDYAIDY